MFITVQTEKIALAIVKGNCLIRDGQYEKALTHYETLLLIVDESTPHHLRCCYTNLGVALRNLDQTDLAVDAYMKALDVRGDEDDSNVNAIRGCLANALLDQKRPEEALLFLSPAEEYFKGQFNRERLGEVLETKARALLALGNKLDALAAAHEAENLLYAFCMDREATDRDVSKSFSRAVNTLAVCTFEFRCGSGVNAERF
jgi:tetratricopeptide (TPR) repeat protein